MIELTIHEIVLWLAGMALLVGVASYAAKMRQKEQDILEKRRLDSIGKTKPKSVQFVEEQTDQELRRQIEETKLRLNNK